MVEKTDSRRSASSCGNLRVPHFALRISALKEHRCRHRPIQVRLTAPRSTQNTIPSLRVGSTAAIHGLVRPRKRAGARAARLPPRSSPYGPTPAGDARYVPFAGAGSPVVMFIHGGYWRALSSKEFSFVAARPGSARHHRRRDELCPLPGRLRSPRSPRQSHAAVAWLAGNAWQFCGGSRPTSLRPVTRPAASKWACCCRSGRQEAARAAGRDQGRDHRSAACSICGRCSTPGCSRPCS